MSIISGELNLDHSAGQMSGDQMSGKQISEDEMPAKKSQAKQPKEDKKKTNKPKENKLPFDQMSGDMMSGGLISEDEMPAKKLQGKKPVNKPADKPQANKMSFDQMSGEMSGEMSGDLMSGGQISEDEIPAKKPQTKKPAEKKPKAKKTPFDQMSGDMMSGDQMSGKQISDDEMLATKSQRKKPAADNPKAKKMQFDQMSGDQMSEDEMPAKKIPMPKLPAKKLPGLKLQADQMSGGQISGDEMPAKKSQAKKPPADEMSGEEMSGNQMSGRQMFGNRVSAEQISEDEMPAEKPQVQNQAVKKLPAEEMSGDQMSGDQMSGRQMSGGQMSVEQISEDEMPAKKQPTKKLTAHNMPTNIVSAEQLSGEQGSDVEEPYFDEDQFNVLTQLATQGRMKKRSCFDKLKSLIHDGSFMLLRRSPSAAPTEIDNVSVFLLDNITVMNDDQLGLIGGFSGDPNGSNRQMDVEDSVGSMTHIDALRDDRRAKKESVISAPKAEVKLHPALARVGDYLAKGPVQSSFIEKKEQEDMSINSDGSEVKMDPEFEVSVEEDITGTMMVPKVKKRLSGFENKLLKKKEESPARKTLNIKPTQPRIRSGIRDKKNSGWQPPQENDQVDSFMDETLVTSLFATTMPLASKLGAVAKNPNAEKKRGSGNLMNTMVPSKAAPNAPFSMNVQTKGSSRRGSSKKGGDEEEETFNFKDFVKKQNSLPVAPGQKVKVKEPTSVVEEESQFTFEEKESDDMPSELDGSPNSIGKAIVQGFGQKIGHDFREELQGISPEVSTSSFRKMPTSEMNLVLNLVPVKTAAPDKDRVLGKGSLQVILNYKEKTEPRVSGSFKVPRVSFFDNESTITDRRESGFSEISALGRKTNSELSTNLLIHRFRDEINKSMEKKEQAFRQRTVSALSKASEDSGPVTPGLPNFQSFGGNQFFRSENAQFSDSQSPFKCFSINKVNYEEISGHPDVEKGGHGLAFSMAHVNSLGKSKTVLVADGLTRLRSTMEAHARGHFRELSKALRLRIRPMNAYPFEELAHLFQQLSLWPKALAFQQIVAQDIELKGAQESLGKLGDRLFRRHLLTSLQTLQLESQKKPLVQTVRALVCKLFYTVLARYKQNVFEGFVKITFDKNQVMKRYGGAGLIFRMPRNKEKILAMESRQRGTNSPEADRPRNSSEAPNNFFHFSRIIENPSEFMRPPRRSSAFILKSELVSDSIGGYIGGPVGGSRDRGLHQTERGAGVMNFIRRFSSSSSGVPQLPPDLYSIPAFNSNESFGQRVSVHVPKASLLSSNPVSRHGTEAHTQMAHSEMTKDVLKNLTNLIDINIDNLLNDPLLALDPQGPLSSESGERAPTNSHRIGSSAQNDVSEPPGFPARPAVRAPMAFHISPNKIDSEKQIEGVTSHRSHSEIMSLMSKDEPLPSYKVTDMLLELEVLKANLAQPDSNSSAQTPSNYTPSSHTPSHHTASIRAPSNRAPSQRAPSQRVPSHRAPSLHAMPEAELLPDPQPESFRNSVSSNASPIHAKKLLFSLHYLFEANRSRTMADAALRISDHLSGKAPAKLFFVTILLRMARFAILDAAEYQKRRAFAVEDIVITLNKNHRKLLRKALRCLVSGTPFLLSSERHSGRRYDADGNSVHTDFSREIFSGSPSRQEGEAEAEEADGADVPFQLLSEDRPLEEDDFYNNLEDEYNQNAMGHLQLPAALLS